MNSLLLIFRKIKLLVTRERFDKDLAEEMAFHRDQRANDFQANGLTPESARYAAEREFGNRLRIKEQSQEMVSFQFETAWQDIRYALRQLRKNPAFASITILILALGMCASISIFAFVDAALIKPLPYPNPTRLVDVTESIAMLPHANLSYPDYLDWKKLNNVFSSMDIHDGSGYLLRTGGGTEVVQGARVSAGFFRTLGVTPILGRDFHAGEDEPEAPAIVMLSYGTWQKRFGGRTDVIGQTVSR